MTEREADLMVADDAELEGRHDVAAELRARHLSSVEQLAEQYRVRLGLLPWARHAAQARRMVIDYGRRTGRTTRDMLQAFAKCELEDVKLLMVIGSETVRRHCEPLARELSHRLTFDRVVIEAVSDRSPHLWMYKRHVAYRDHLDHEQEWRRRTASTDYEQALIAWCRYHVATETFDRSISSVRDPRGDAVVDHDSWVRSRSSAFAREQRAKMTPATDHHTSQRAKEQVCSWSYETQRRFLEDHGISVGIERDEPTWNPVADTDWT